VDSALVLITFTTVNSYRLIDWLVVYWERLDNCRFLESVCLPLGGGRLLLRHNIGPVLKFVVSRISFLVYVRIESKRGRDSEGVV